MTAAEELERRRHGAEALPEVSAARAAELTLAERRAVVDTFLVVLEGLYAHLPLKRARYGVDPVQRLRLLRGRTPSMPDADFHAEMSDIVTGLRDAHTRYQGFTGTAGLVAALPFLAEGYGPLDAPRYVVSKVGPPDLVGDPGFVPGVELLSWSGVPFDRAVARWGDSETGGRPDARRARALQSLTFRSLEYGPPPDEAWVAVGYRDSGGVEREVRLHWRTVRAGPALTAPGAAAPVPAPRRRSAGERQPPDARSALAALALDPAAEAARRARQLMFAPDVWWRARHDPGEAGAPPPGAGVVPTTMPDVLLARRVETAAGPVGHLRIWTFTVRDDEAFVREVARLLDELPGTGLVVDVRGNPGGLVWAAERALQLFTPHPVTPGRFSWLATDLTRTLVANPVSAAEGRGWLASLEDAVSTGDDYSQGRPLTDPEACNDVGQRYGGPVLCVADASTYSAGDLFAAGWVDNRVGPLVTVGSATGAGGANVWGHALVRQGLAGTRFELPDLPSGVGFTVAVRRFTRVGDAAGTLVEDLGVPGDETYAMTRTDLVDANSDLLEWCAERLSRLPRTSLRVTPRSGARGTTLVVATSGLDVVDLYADRHPWTSFAPGSRARRLRVREGAREVEVVGWARGAVTQRRRLVLG